MTCSSSAMWLGSPSPWSTIRSRCTSARHVGASPAIATWSVSSASSMNRSCRRTPMRAPGGIATLPSVAGSSPATIFKNVVLPEPLAPTSPYRDPRLSWNDASRKSVRPPYDLPSWETPIIEPRAPSTDLTNRAGPPQDAGVTPLDEDSARALIGALVERRLLLLATKTSAAPLAAGLAEQAFESAAEIAEWLVDQESVVDLLASDEDIESALEPAPKTPQVPPPRKLEAASWRWDPEGTSLTVTATTLEGVIEGAREWWDRAVEIASASDDEVDAILCYLEDDGLAAVALFDPEA